MDFLRDFDMLEVLGQGGFGHVIRCRRRNKGDAHDEVDFPGVVAARDEYVAIKMVPLVPGNVREDVLLERELYALQANGGHPNVVEMHEFKRNEIYAIFVMELCDQNLRQFMRSRVPRMDLNAVRPIAREIVSGMLHIHGNGMCHRDLKPENILLKDNVIKIGDFGLARMVPPINPDGSVTLSVVGTRSYMAPEMAAAYNAGRYNDHYNPQKVDAFAVGVILFEMATGRTPFTRDEMTRLDFGPTAEERLVGELSMLGNADFSQMVVALLKWDRGERAYISHIQGNGFLV